MSKMSRAEFLGLSGVLAGAAIGCRPAVPSSQQAGAVQGAMEPDLVVVNARVYTIDGARPRAEAFAIKDGRFVAVGEQQRHHATSRAGAPQVIDAAQMTVTPGFIDAHCHPSGVNELYEVNANVRTVKELQQALRKKAADTPPGFWIDGLHVRRHQARRAAPPQAPGRGRPEPSGRCASSRWTHELVQQQGAGACRHHAGDARPRPRPLFFGTRVES